MMSKDPKNTKNEEVNEDVNREDAEQAAAKEGAEGEAQTGEASEEDEKIDEVADTTEGSAADADEMNAKYLRLMADFHNFKRRTEKEKGDIYAFANEKIISELLNVIDNFERALEHGAEGDSFAEGMNMIFKQLKEVLEKAGVTEIEALGLDFDPNFHNAVMTEDSEQYDSGKVTAVLQKGYILNNRVIRPSMVKVAN